MDFGVQIFGCLEECKKDPEAFFHKLSQAGYRQIEPCILFDDPVRMAEDAILAGDDFTRKLAHNIWKPDEVPEYLRMMKKHGLKLSSVHVFADDPLGAAEALIETARENHITAYVVNCNQQTVASEYKAFAKECGRLSRKLREHDIELWIHNNGAEIKARVEHKGKQVPVLSAILELCSRDGVGAQIDVGWVLYGGFDPARYLAEIKQYVRSIHYKDLKKDYAVRTDGDIFACLGEGALKVKDILECIPIGPDMTVLVDQDASDGDIMEDMVKSYKVLQDAAISSTNGAHA